MQRHMAAMPLGTKDDKPLSEQEKKLLLLRQLADEYEVGFYVTVTAISPRSDTIRKGDNSVDTFLKFQGYNHN